MDPMIRETLLLNRVKILKFCDYFVVTAPMLAKRILPMDKHKEFKNRVGLGPGLDLKAANNARLDSLLEFMDECTTPGAFDAFIEGVKECEGQKKFANTLKKMGQGIKIKLPKPRPAVGAAGPGGQGPVKPKAKTPVKRPAPPPITPGTMVSGSSGSPPLLPYSTLPIHPSIMQPQPSPSGAPKGGLLNLGIGSTPRPIPPPATQKKPKKAGAKKTAVQNGPGPSGPLTSTSISVPPVSFIPLVTAPISSTATPKQKQPKGKTAAQKRGQSTSAAPTPTATATLKTKTPKKSMTKSQLNGGQGGVILKLEGNPMADKKKTPAKGKKGDTKMVKIPSIPIPSLVGLSVGGSDAKSGGAGAAGKKKEGFVTRVPPGSPFRRRVVGGAKLKKMTFREVEEKQKSTMRATTFTFINPSAVVKTIHFNNKSDLFYEGCPTRANNQLCAKKVQLIGKGKKYVCKEKHENESYELFPRLYVTFEDETTHMQTTLYRENVEMLAGKPMSEIHRMDDSSLKGEFLKAHRKNIPIQVKAKKILKKEVKKSGGASWENVASIITDSDPVQGPPPAKRSRKSTD